jgi:signal transduction histidine kinase
MRSPFSTDARGVFITALLLATLLLTGILARLAHRTVSDYRATADHVFQDYARLAAARFASRTAQELYYVGFWPAIYALQHGPEGELEPPRKIDITGEPAAAELWKQAHYTFRLDLRSGRLETAGDAPAPPIRRWLADTVRAHSQHVYESRERIAMIVTRVGGVSRAIVYTVVPDPHPVPGIVMGFEVDPIAFKPFYTMAQEQFPLLPGPLTGGVVYDSLASIAVEDAAGNELYRSAVQYPGTFAARDSLQAAMGSVHVQVSLRPDLEPRLIIGGMPRSRLPLLLALLGLSAVLVVAALLLLRRENELSRLRADFVSGVSHELRTPLAQIRMFAETVALGRVRSDTERMRSLQIIDQEARRLTHLVANLLHFARSERQYNRVTAAPTSLAPLIGQIVDDFSPLALRGTRLRTELAENVEALVDADALRQMLLNLLDNAVKYGRANQTVTVRLVAVPRHARISVDDEGPGVPPPDRERVWGRFTRLERDRGSAVAGTGIGLSVVRELTALHGGRTWVEDAPTPPGARFVIELPLVAAELRTDPEPDTSAASRGTAL